MSTVPWCRNNKQRVVCNQYKTLNMTSEKKINNSNKHTAATNGATHNLYVLYGLLWNK